MTDRVLKLREFIIADNLSHTQTFRTRNLVGDPMANIYDHDDIQVDYCRFWNYLEIFGLSDEEYESMADLLDISDLKSNKGKKNLWV